MLEILEGGVRGQCAKGNRSDRHTVRQIESEMYQEKVKECLKLFKFILYKNIKGVCNGVSFTSGNGGMTGELSYSSVLRDSALTFRSFVMYRKRNKY